MPRPREEDRRRIQELEGALLQLRLDGHFELERVLHEARDLLGVEQTAAWGGVREGDDYRLLFSFVSGARVRAGATAEIAEQDLDRVASSLRPRLPAGKQELRLLLCSSVSLVAWIGAFQTAEFSARQRAILNALVPAFRRRVAAERALADAEDAEAGLTVAMAAIARPAFIVDDAGCVRHVNRAGQELLASRREEVAAELAAATRQSARAVEVTRIESSGRHHFLVVYRDDGIDPAPRLAAAAARWKLTPRQIDVLRRVVTGDPNKVIAADLRRAESTVELHVTEILRRAGVENRVALVARFWSMR